jgi:hypothetical protein
VVWFGLQTAPLLQAHGVYPDQVAGHLAIGERACSGYLRLLPELFDLWMGLQREHVALLSQREALQGQQAATEFLAKHFEVTIDNIVVRPQVGDISIADVEHTYGPVRYIRVPLSYPLKHEPSVISLVWKRFDMLDTMPDRSVLLLIEDERRQRDVLLTNEEPQFIWRAPRPPSAPVSQEVVQLPQQGMHAILVGRLAEATLLLLATLLGVMWTSGWSRVAIYRFVSSGLLLFGGFVAASYYEGERAGRTAVRPPSLEDGQRIFTALHANIYRAFDYKSESDIYAALAESVEGPLLDAIYVQVFKSLVDEEQNGARAAVDKIDYEICTAFVDPLQADFTVECSWRVHASIAHWGHAHQRVIYHRARGVVRHGAQGWRITAIDLLAQQVVKRSFTGGGDPATQPR